MHTHHHHLVLLLLPLLGCVAVTLVDGGTSPPPAVSPLSHDHSDQPLPDASSKNEATSSQAEAAGSVEDHVEAHEKEQNNSTVEENNHTGKENGMIQVTDDGIVNVTQPKPQTSSTSTTTTSTSTRTSTSTSISTSTSTSTTTHLVPSAKTTTKVTITTKDQSQNSQAPTTAQPPLHPCHLSCLGALNATHLTPNDSLALSAGSSLTLECQMPLVPELVLVDMLWLFHPGGTPEGRCSLTPHKYLPTCPGSPTLSETDYRNGTFLKQTLTLSDLGTNHTGDYMCQVQVTCCPGEEQHTMAKQCEAQVSVRVWWADYTLELAGTGVVAGVLLLTLFGVSVYGWKYGNKNHYLPVVEVQPSAVLHLPLIDDQDDQDTDSFNSSIADEQEKA